MKKQVVTIGGGDSFTNHDDFLQYLKTVPLHNPTGQSKIGWRSDLPRHIPDDECYTLSMPNTENARYDEWCIWFERHIPFFTGTLVLVGYSLGGMFLAKYLSENKVSFTISKIFLLGAPCGFYDDGTGNDCGSFGFDPTDLENIRQNVKDIEIWHSTDDFVVPYEHALRFQKYLPEAKLVTFTDRNHFLQEELPELVAQLHSL
jgi:uncharacterized protein